jgi:hypothetical protein
MSSVWGREDDLRRCLYSAGLFLTDTKCNVPTPLMTVFNFIVPIGPLQTFEAASYQQNVMVSLQFVLPCCHGYREEDCGNAPITYANTVRMSSVLIWALRSCGPKTAWSRQAGDVRLSGVHSHLWTVPETRQVPGSTQDRPEAPPCKAQSAEGGASTTMAPVSGRTWAMVEKRVAGLL